jgi:alkylation response protein AidB-like acyl-CoA dehydrogenase
METLVSWQGNIPAPLFQTDSLTCKLRKVIMASNETTTITELRELVQRSMELRKEIAKSSAEVDARGDDPEENLQHIWEAGLYRINIPAAYGGLSDGTLTFSYEALTETLINISAGEGSTGQIYFIQALIARELFHPQVNLPEATRQQLAHEILQENVRFVSSNAEAGTSGRVTSHHVEGGIVLNGTKTFNTASEGARYAAVGHQLEGVEGMHSALVHLDAPGVRLHHDWENMGQRATASQTITYEQVFVQDGWHFHMPPLVLSTLIPLLFIMHGAVMLGIGRGGFDAMLEYIRTNQRTIFPGSKNSSEDPLISLRVGDLSTALAAAHALQREVARQAEVFVEGSDITELSMHASRAKIASIEAALKVTGELHELTGARSTSNTYRLDRFWRDARTFSTLTPTDLRRLAVGEYELGSQLSSSSLAQVMRGRI